VDVSSEYISSPAYDQLWDTAERLLGTLPLWPGTGYEPVRATAEQVQANPDWHADSKGRGPIIGYRLTDRPPPMLSLAPGCPSVPIVGTEYESVLSDLRTLSMEGLLRQRVSTRQHRGTMHTLILRDYRPAALAADGQVVPAPGMAGQRPWLLYSESTHSTHSAASFYLPKLMGAVAVSPDGQATVLRAEASFAKSTQQDSVQYVTAQLRGLQRRSLGARRGRRRED